MNLYQDSGCITLTSDLGGSDDIKNAAVSGLVFPLLYQYFLAKMEIFIEITYGCFLISKTKQLTFITCNCGKCVKFTFLKVV